MERAGPPPGVRWLIRRVRGTRERAQSHRNQLHPSVWEIRRVRGPRVGVPAGPPASPTEERTPGTHGENTGEPGTSDHDSGDVNVRSTSGCQKSRRRSTAASDRAPAPSAEIWDGTGWRWPHRTPQSNHSPTDLITRHVAPKSHPENITVAPKTYPKVSIFQFGMF